MKYLKKFYESNLNELSDKEIEEKLEYLNIDLEDIKSEIRHLTAILSNRKSEVYKFYEIGTEDDNTFIKVYKNKIIELFDFVGEGIDEIEVNEKTVSILFIENTWGGISMDEWIRLEEKVKNIMALDNQLYFDIDAGRNILYFYFHNYDYDVELY
jgi:hypothetical protein